MSAPAARPCRPRLTASQGSEDQRQRQTQTQTQTQTQQQQMQLLLHLQAAGVVTLCSGARERAALDLHSPVQRRAGGGSARRVTGRMPVSLASVHGWTVDKPRRPHADFAGIHARKARKRGGLSFGYFSLATQRKVTRPPKEDESS